MTGIRIAVADHQQQRRRERTSATTEAVVPKADGTLHLSDTQRNDLTPPVCGAGRR